MSAYRTVELAEIDIVAISLLVARCLPHEAWSESQLLAHIQHPDTLNLGAYDEGQLIAFGISRVVLDEAELYQIATHPDYVGRGIGTQLMNDMLSLWRLRGCVMGLLEVNVTNASALRLYEKAGFIENGRRAGYYRTESGRQDAVLMQRVLAEG
jgi:ribosomal-protein-alanine N-acetyltransferase